MSFPREGSMIGKARPGGKSGNSTANVSAPDDATRKARPVGEKGYPTSTATSNSDRNAVRKSRPKSSGSGQSTDSGPGRTP